MTTATSTHTLTEAPAPQMVLLVDRTLAIWSKWSKRLGDYTKVDLYTVSEFPNQMDGRSFRLDKDGTDEHYNCLLCNPQDTLCDCKGFEAHGHCKHISALAQLIGEGKLDALNGVTDAQIEEALSDSECPF